MRTRNQDCRSGSALFLITRIRIRAIVKNWIRIRINVKIQKLSVAQNRAVDAHNGGLGLNMEPLRVYGQVVADSHHFEFKGSWIRIRIKGVQIRNTAPRRNPVHAPSVLGIRDVYLGSRILIFPIQDPNIWYHPGSRTRIKEFKYFNPKNFSKLSEI